MKDRPHFQVGEVGGVTGAHLTFQGGCAPAHPRNSHTDHVCTPPYICMYIARRGTQWVITFSGPLRGGVVSKDSHECDGSRYVRNGSGDLWWVNGNPPSWSNNFGTDLAFQKS